MFASANPTLISGYDFIAAGIPQPVDFLTQPNEIHFMLDLETLATTPDAAITEIGCVRLDTGRTFNCHVIDTLGRRTPETILWRTENNLPWKHVVDAESNCYPLYTALGMFFDWLKLEANGAELVLWCKGTDFDKVIATAAAKSVDLIVPWKYNNFFDMRTLLKLFPQFKVPKEQVTHTALEDAILQACQLLKIAAELYEVKQEGYRQ